MSIYYRWGDYLRSFGGDTSWAEEQTVVVPSEDGTEVYEFTPEGRHQKTRDALTGALLHEFGYVDDRLVSVTDGSGNVTQIERDASGTPTAIVAPGGQRTELALDDNGYLSSVTNPNNEQLRMTYTPEGLLTELIDARDGVHKFRYDDLGRLRADEDPLTSQDDTPEDPGVSWRSLSRSETADGYEVSISTALGYVTTYLTEVFDDDDDGVVDTMHRTITRPDSSSTQIVEEADGTTTTTRADGTVATVTEARDPRFGLAAPLRSTTVTTPEALSRSVVHLRAATFTDPDDPTTLTQQTDTFTFNDTRQVTVAYEKTTTPEARTVVTSAPGCNDGDSATPCRKSQVELDEHGPVAVLDADGPDSGKLPVTTYTYSPDTGQLESVSVASADAGEGTRTFNFGYYSSGPSNMLLETITQPDGEVVTLSYDAATRLTGSTIPGQSERLDSERDPEGRLLAVTTPTNELHSLSYDPVGLPDTYDPPLVDGHTTLDLRTDHDFDLDRRWTLTLQPDGQTITPTYEPDTGRLDKIEAELPARVLDYSYDAEGRVSQIDSLVYDAQQNLIPDPVGGTVTFGYDGPFLLSETWSGGAVGGTVARVLDNDFQLTDQKLTCVSPATCTNLELVAGGDDFLYDADGLLEQAGALVIGRDDDTGQVTGTTLTNVTTTQQHNGFGEAKLLQASHDTVGELYSEQILERDAMGRITVREETVEGVTTRYNYDYWEMGRLERVSTGTPDVDEVCEAEYTYDANGNRLSTACGDSTPTATYDAQDRLTGSPGASYTHTLDGSLETKTDAGGVTATVYDAFGNLLTVVLPDATQIDYAVDARGRRIGKYVNGNSTPVKSWLYQDRLRPVAELDGSGLLRARFVYGSGRNVPDYMITYAADGTELSTYRFVVDHLGSVRLVVNASTGVVAQRMMHDVWGNVTEDTNPGFQPFGFAGGLYDPDTGLVRFGARDYNPAVGRWTAKDPIRFDGGQANLYVYVGNDPVDGIDPYGLEWSTGVAVHASTVNPFTSGGGDVWGVNQQSFHGPGTTDDFYYSGDPGGVVGLDVGAAAELVGAWGDGAWAGSFHSININVGTFAASVFWSPGYWSGPGWAGITFGVGLGLPGAGYEETTYERLQDALDEMAETAETPCP